LTNLTPLSQITNPSVLNFLKTNFPLIDFTQTNNPLTSNQITIDESVINQLIDDYLKKSKKGLTNNGTQNKKETNSATTTPEFLETPNLISHKQNPDKEPEVEILRWEVQLETAKRIRQQNDTKKSAVMLVDILENCPEDEIKKKAFLELALVAQQENQLLKAYQIYAQFLQTYPDDPLTPEVLLRQGLIIRNIGASTLALSKFYAVLSRALSLKMDQLSYYQRIVLQAQTEIADTYYILGRYEEAADFFNRLLRLDNQELNREYIQFKLIQSLSYIGNHEKVIAQARDFLTKYPNSSDQAEVRFRLAQSLKALGRTSEALRETLALLELSKTAPASDFHKWFYWQQRVGNEIANQLYKEGDYINALEIYNSLAAINTAPFWQLPVLYQIGLVFERLKQPIKASEYYSKIISKETELGTNSAQSLKIVVDMAKWRKEFLKWQTNAENIVILSRLPGILNTNNTGQTVQ
jgi:tetratricopeptide (TPR) repeat protein